MQVSYAVLAAAVIIGGVLLYTQRYQVWHDSAAFYVVHDGWTGKFIACRVQELRSGGSSVSLRCQNTSGSGTQ